MTKLAPSSVKVTLLAVAIQPLKEPVVKSVVKVVELKAVSAGQVSVSSVSAEQIWYEQKKHTVERVTVCVGLRGGQGQHRSQRNSSLGEVHDVVAVGVVNARSDSIKSSSMPTTRVIARDKTKEEAPACVRPGYEIEEAGRVGGRSMY
mgnify:CR=1 FL=1